MITKKAIFSLSVCAGLLFPNLAFSQIHEVEICSKKLISIFEKNELECYGNDNLWTLPEGQAVCSLGFLDLGNTALIEKTSVDTLKPPICKFPMESDGENSQQSLLGYRIKDAEAVALSAKTIKVSENNANEVIRTFNFSNRKSEEPWVSFSSSENKSDVSDYQTLFMYNVGQKLFRSVPLKVSPEFEKIVIKNRRRWKGDTPEEFPQITLENKLIDLRLDKTADVSAVTFDLLNEYQEAASMRLELKTKYFSEDRRLVEKQTSLALMYKIAADESYLRAAEQCTPVSSQTICEPYKAAYELYTLAFQAIPKCDNSSNDLSQVQSDHCEEEDLITSWDLLKSDISYRKKLIEWGLPFYGGFRALSPTTPHHELLKMEAYLEDMTELMSRIDTLQERYKKGEIDNAVIQAEKSYALGQYDASEIDQTIGATNEKYATLDVDSYQARQKILVQEIQGFQDRLEDLEKQQDALSENATALTKAGIAAVSGVPIGDIEALASGDLQKVAENYIQRELASTGSALAEDLIASSEVAQGIAEKVGEVQKVVDQLEDIEQQVSTVEKAIKGDRGAIKDLVNRYGSTEAQDLFKQAEELEQTVENAIAMTKSFDRQRALDFLESELLTPEQRKEIRELVEEIKPIERIFEAAYVQLTTKDFDEVLLTEFENQLNKVLKEVRPSSQEISNMKSELKALYTNKNFDLSDPYFGRKIIVALDSIEDENRKILDSVLVLDPSFLTNIPEVKAMIDRLPTKDKARVIKELNRASNIKEKFVKVDRGKICIKKLRENNCISFGAVRSRFKREYKEVSSFTSDKVKKFLDQELDGLNDEGVILLYLAKDGPGGFSGNLGRIFQGPNARLKDAWQNIDYTGGLFSNTEVSSAGEVAVAELITAAKLAKPKTSHQINESLAPKANSSSSTSASTGTSASISNDGGPDPTTNAIVQGALNYALPGAGIALQLGQTWASMDANRELQEDIHKSLSAAIREQDQLTRSKQLATRTAALSDLQRQRAVSVRRAGQQQIEKFEVALSASMDAQQFNRELMALYRPRFYYIAEALREKFEAYDRSLADWSQGRSEAGFFKQAILEDPGKARLALDSEIQLFGWLNRNIESTRTSPYVLHHHWERVIGLAREYCSDYGCKPGDGGLGQIGITVPQAFFEDIEGPASKKEFIQWRDDSSRSRSFRYSFSFVPGDFGLPEDALNVRILDVSIVPVDRKGKRLKGSSVNLKHEGFSSLVLLDGENPGQTETVRHALLPREALAANRLESEDVQKLRGRFRNQTKVAAIEKLRDFEGYGLFGSYQIEILSGPKIDRIDDLIIEFSYIYTNSENVTSERDFIASRQNETCGNIQGNNEPLTGVLCSRNVKMEYKAATLSSSGDLVCSNDIVASIEVGDVSTADYYRTLGDLQCFNMREIYKPKTVNTNPVIDFSAAMDKGTCSAAEVKMLVSHKEFSDKCYGGVRR